MAFQSFEDLKVWQRGKQLAVEVYRAMNESRDFGLKDQMQRAAISIASNIAEGHERTPKDFAIPFNRDWIIIKIKDTSIHC